MNISSITHINFIKNRNPSYFHGWSFISFEENYADDALPFQTFADLDGPIVLFNPNFVSREDMENPTVAMLWIPLVLQAFATNVLAEALDSDDDIGAFSSIRWDNFREAFCHFTNLEWQEILERTEEFGIDYMAEYAIEALFVESGIHEMVVARQSGCKGLRTA